MENKYPNIRCDKYVTMPNHFHCIIGIIGNRIINNDNPDAHVAPLRGRPSPEKCGDLLEIYGPNNKKYNAAISQMIDWFKTMTTNEYIRGVRNHNWPRYSRKLWQQNYWEHIIRSKEDLTRISNYIKNNP